jgi:hypothetical protein
VLQQQVPGNPELLHREDQGLEDRDHQLLVQLQGALLRHLHQMVQRLREEAHPLLLAVALLPHADPLLLLAVAVALLLPLVVVPPPLEEHQLQEAVLALLPEVDLEPSNQQSLQSSLTKRLKHSSGTELS